jgi:nucleoside-diphosphate-sugar epimerase
VDPIRARRPEVCVHLAWKGWSGKAEADANLSSLGVSLELLRKMPELACPRFVAAGTCFEYDLSAAVLSESTPLRPHDLYGGCKKSLFEVAQEFSALTGVSVVTPRIFYSYGPLEDARRLVPSITQALLRGEIAKATAGEQVRDYLHAADIASAIWAIAQSDATGAVNVASGEPVTIAQIATRIADLLGRSELLQLGALKYRDGEPMHILGDAGRLRSLGWAAKHTLDTGLAETVEWWQQKLSYA